jgi:hypothetical protein
MCPEILAHCIILTDFLVNAEKCRIYREHGPEDDCDKFVIHEKSLPVTQAGGKSEGFITGLPAIRG